MNTLKAERKDKSYHVPILLGIAIRLFIAYLYPTIHLFLDERAEISTPLTSWKRLLEGVYLFTHGLPVYGSSFNQPPIFLLFALVPSSLAPLIFILCDYVIAKSLITLATYKARKDQSEHWPEALPAEEGELMSVKLDKVEIEKTVPKLPSRPYEDPLEDSSLIAQEATKPIDFHLNPTDIASIYLLNPLSILSCLSRSTQIFSTASMALGLVYASRGNRRASMFALAVGTYLSLYPFLLLAPCILFINEYHSSSKMEELIVVEESDEEDYLVDEETHSKKVGSDNKIKEVVIQTPQSGESMRTTIIKSIVGLISYTAILLYLSSLLLGSWTFLETYSLIIFVKDLRPNIGLYWYFFMEVFDQFRTFFITVFHLNVFVFSIPICIKFRSQPLFASFLITASIALFKSYPSIADTSFYISLLATFTNLHKYSPHLYLSLSGLLYACLLGPLFFNSWTQGSGNANFFYAITLLWSVSQIIMVVDLGYAMLKREFERLNPGWRQARVELLYLYNE